MLKKTILGSLLLAASATAFAELTVVVHPDNANVLDAKTIQRIYLGKDKKFPDGNEILVVNQGPDEAVRQTFDKDILGRSTSQVSAYWSKLVFTGKGVPPKEVNSDAEVIKLVSKNPSVVGYVDSSSVNATVKALKL